MLVFHGTEMAHILVENMAGEYFRGDDVIVPNER